MQKLREEVAESRGIAVEATECPSELIVRVMNDDVCTVVLMINRRCNSRSTRPFDRCFIPREFRNRFHSITSAFVCSRSRLWFSVIVETGEMGCVVVYFVRVRVSSKWAYKSASGLYQLSRQVCDSVPLNP